MAMSKRITRTPYGVAIKTLQATPSGFTDRILTEFCCRFPACSRLLFLEAVSTASSFFCSVWVNPITGVGKHTRRVSLEAPCVQLVVQNLRNDSVCSRFSASARKLHTRCARSPFQRRFLAKNFSGFVLTAIAAGGQSSPIKSPAACPTSWDAR